MDAQHLFDVMPNSRRNSKRAAAVEEDRIGALPDGVLQLVLSSLPSDEAVRTCVLSWRWQHLWKSAPALCITRGVTRDWRPRELINFVNRLLLLRGGSPADECVISRDKFLMDDGDELFWNVNLWIRHVFSFCRVRVLKICIFTSTHALRLADTPFVSQILTRVELKYATLRMQTLDFSSCPVLENLSMRYCIICGNRILSQSVRSLSITVCHFEATIRTRISAPCLISLQLDRIAGRAPLLDRMHLLVAAQVKLDYCCYDMCRHNVYGDCDSENCRGHVNNHDGSNSCVLLESLSGATSLELTNDYEVNSPILEKLTLELEDYEIKQPVVETGDSYNPQEQSLVSKQLKAVEIKCHKENELVEQISIILRIHGVSPDQIEIQENLLPSETSSFDPDSDW